MKPIRMTLQYSGLLTAARAGRRPRSGLMIGLAALLLFPFCGAPGAAMEPPRLNALPVVYYQFTGVGLAWLQTGYLDAFRGLVLDHGRTISIEPGFPEAAFDRPLILETDWQAFGRFAPASVDNFRIIEEGKPIVIGKAKYFEVRIADLPSVYLGEARNLSTRAMVGRGPQVVIGGFVVTDYPRVVLIRGVGPTLTRHGVADPVANPFVTLYRNATPFLESTDWGLRDRDLMRAAAEEVGAFPLLEGSKDAALLVELLPGSYTVRMGVESGEPGVGLLEVYFLPPDSRLSPP